MLQYLCSTSVSKSTGPIMFAIALTINQLQVVLKQSLLQVHRINYFSKTFPLVIHGFFNVKILLRILTQRFSLNFLFCDVSDGASFYLFKTPFTRDRIRVISTFSSVTLRSHLLLPLFLWYVLIKFCNIITNLRVMLVLKLVKLIW